MASGEKWTDKVRRADPNNRNYLREAMISLNAAIEISKDTGQTRFAFEGIENFPVYDLLDYTGSRLDILKDQRLLDLYEQRSMPDLSTQAAIRMFESLPKGTLGYEYGRYVKERKLDNIFLEYLVVDSPATYLIYRIAHLHDLFHFILGYEAYDPIGEMEVELYLYAQNHAVNHILFAMGYVAFLLRNNPRQLWEGRERLLEAYRFGRRTANLLLVRWEDQMSRPIHDVRRELGIAERPVSRPDLTPKTTPKLSHVALNVQDRKRAENFYARVYGYEVAARDDRLGVTFMTSGDDHHTIALQEAWPTGPFSTVRGIVRNAPRVFNMLKSRWKGEASKSGRKTVVPPAAVAWAHLKPGLSHVGYRAQNLEELKAYYHLLKSAGVKIDWAVNHNDMVKGLYFRDPSGNFCELFVDGEEVQEMKKERDAGKPVSDFRIDDFRNYELDLEKELDIKA